MKSKKLAYIETFGCQMNERDSEIMEQLLAESSCRTTRELDKADIVVVNTCSIRGKAEQKAFSLLGRLKSMKKKRPGLLVAVAGCVAQQEGEKIIERMPHVDLVIGPQHIYKLSELVSPAPKTLQQRVLTSQSSSFTIPAYLPTLDTEHIPTHKRFVTIMQGCNNFCTYCVVPFTRGREISRSVEDIENEVLHLVQQGVKEITLLGQNVNSYGLDMATEQRITFPELLRRVAAIPGLARLRFTTSNPQDLSRDLMRCFEEIDILCPQFHLPVQSGSNPVLKRMNRKYTAETYLGLVDELRSHCPEIAISTDIIVGFPGETEEDFAATMALIEKVRYHSAFSFKYSDRPHTRSAGFPDKVPEKEKGRRLTILQKRQEEITLERNREYVGQELLIMVEGASKNSASQLCGRSASNHTVNVELTDATRLAEYRPGQLVKVRIFEACSHSLRGELL